MMNSSASVPSVQWPVEMAASSTRRSPSGTVTVVSARGDAAVRFPAGNRAPWAQAGRATLPSPATAKTSAASTSQAGVTHVSMKTSKAQWPLRSGATRVTSTSCSMGPP
ncbi:MAG: hypothetical protein IPH86_19620 [bacterium]|nr:hypothetical protein [bacterium]